MTEAEPSTGRPRRRVILVGCVVGAAVAALAGWALVAGTDDPRGPGSAEPSTSASGAPALPCDGLTPSKPGGGAYACAFTEEFDGDELDRSRWLVQDTTYSGMTSGHKDCFRDDPEQFELEDGMLRLTARQTAQPFTCRGPRGTFTSQSRAAAIATRDRFAQTYGRFEFRARFPGTTAPGVHSALWLYPNRTTYGKWPHSGEVDVAEWFSAHTGLVYPSVHYAGENRKLSSGRDCKVSTANSEFHTYAVEWTPTFMRFLYDGRECFRHSWRPSPPLRAPQPFDRPFYVVITQVFGAAWNAVTEETPETATLDVDWVRVWK